MWGKDMATSSKAAWIFPVALGCLGVGILQMTFKWRIEMLTGPIKLLFYWA